MARKDKLMKPSEAFRSHLTDFPPRRDVRGVVRFGFEVIKAEGWDRWRLEGSGVEVQAVVDIGRHCGRR